MQTTLFDSIPEIRPDLPGYPCVLSPCGQYRYVHCELAVAGGWPDPDVQHHINGFREDYQGADCRIRLHDKKGGLMEEWPEDLRVRQMPVMEAVR